MNNNPTLYKFFYRNLKQVFIDLNLRAGRVLDYIASLLTHFTRTSNLYRIKQLKYLNVETVVQMLIEIEDKRFSDKSISAKREVLICRHIGDFTLFMSGIFREYVQKQGVYDFYLLEGSRSYRHVFEYTQQKFYANAKVFHQLSQSFENYSGALDYLKKVYFYYPEIDDLIKQTIKNLLSW